jgi:hypothetical protein
VSVPSIGVRLSIHPLDRHVLGARRLERNISNASILHTDDDGAVLENSEVNPIARLQVRSSPHVFWYRCLTQGLTGPHPVAL